jgi:molecular chaperone GrpE (heat shock protein)
MEVKEGDIFDPNIHEPVSEAERDENFKDDQIKSIEATGFQMTANIHKNEETTIVLKSTEVIIVKN